MSTPFKILWYDVSNNLLSDATFDISFPSDISQPKQLQVRSNATSLLTYNTLINVGFYLTGSDVEIVQNVWPTLGNPNRPELNGGLDISFDFGRTYTRFDSMHGKEGDISTYIPLPIEAVGSNGSAGILGPFDTAHLIIRYVVPSLADQFKQLDVKLAIDFDII